LLAFEIFKKNKNKLLENSIQFEKHPEKDAFAGSEQLLSSSQEAKINTKSLCRALRPFWEGQAEGALDLSQGVISFALTDMDGTNALIDLDIDEDTLNKILHDRIERGVINFFEALRLAFSHSKTSLQDIDSIKIFLAGNSSQSHFVKEIFDKQIALQLEEMGRNSNETSLFELFSPLGADKDDVEKPTGKTGVAFGLIETRAGGRIKVIDNNLLQDDIRFKFYLGENRKGKFKAVINREQSYQQWVEYIDASEADFEFFYTDQPNASSGKMAIDDSALKKTMVELDITDDEAMVYLRIVSPTQIEYVVAHEENIAQEQYLNEIKSIERWVTLTDETYFDKKAGGCWILQADDPYGLYKEFTSGTALIEVEQHINGIIGDPINRWKVPRLIQLKCITGLSTAPFTINKNAPAFPTLHRLRVSGDVIEEFWTHSSFLRHYNPTGNCTPFLPFSSEINSTESIFIAFLKKGLTPLFLENSQEYQILLSIFHRKLENSPFSDDQQLTAEQLLKQQYDQIIDDMVIYALLNEDKIRADINPYHHKMLQDTEQGHWSLWPMNENNEKQEAISLVNKLVARDPKSSINDGVVGIDFGTKSTVVVYQKDNVNIHPMRIGTGDLSQEYPLARPYYFAHRI